MNNALWELALAPVGCSSGLAATKVLCCRYLQIPFHFFAAFRLGTSEGVVSLQLKHARRPRATRWVQVVVAWVSHVTQNLFSGVSCLTHEFEWVVLNALLCVRAAVYPF